MKTIYIEAFAGISGNMLLGALIDAGVPVDYLAAEMEKLHLGAYDLINERVNKCGIAANYFNVVLPEELQHDVMIGQHEHTHAEHAHAGHHHHHENGDAGRLTKIIITVIPMYTSMATARTNMSIRTNNKLL